MASFPIPHELRLIITNHLDPASLLSLASTCKDNWELFESDIHLFAQYHTIDTAKPNTNICRILANVLEDTRRGPYVRKINVPSRHFNGDQLEELLNKEQLGRIDNAGQELGLLYPQEITAEDEWSAQALLQDIPYGTYDSIITILVHKTPLLTSIAVTNIELTSLLILLRSTAFLYNDPLRAPSLLFQNLTTAAVAHHDSESCCGAEWCRFFIAIPSLQNFVSLAMGGDIDNGPYGPLTGAPLRVTTYDVLPQSNVEELYLISSQFSIPALGSILRGIKALKRFTYDAGGAIVCEECGYLSKRVIKLLAEHAGHSLEHLHMAHYMMDSEETEEDLRRVSLRPFKRLKTLRVDWRMIFPNRNGEEDPQQAENQSSLDTVDDYEGDFDIRSILPESLEALHLEGTWQDADKWNGVVKILDSESPMTPNLKSIYLEREIGRDEYQRPVFGPKSTEGAEKLPELGENPLNQYIDGHGYC